MGSPETHRELACLISAFTNAAVLALDYRLAPEHPFPAAVEDAVSAYEWLLRQGYTNEHIAIGGDSSGGGLALQTLLSLRDAGSPLPAAVFLISPQTDWVRFDGESYVTRADVDFWYTPDMYRLTASSYVGDTDPGTPLLSPVNMALLGLPPLCVHVGDNDVLLSDSTRLVERARACNVEVQFKTWPGMWHVFQGAARFVPEARQSIREIGRFVVNRLR
jgi:acetyl esterase/lipase